MHKTVNLADLKAVFDSIGAPIMIINTETSGRLFYAMFNTAAEHYYGLEQQHFQGKEIKPYLGDDNWRRDRRNRGIEAYQDCISSGESKVVEIEHIRPNGELRWGRHTIAPIFDSETQSVVQLMVTSIDVTDLIKTQRELDDAMTRSLSGFVTICAECKNIRSEDGWQTIEEYASDKMNYRNFSHSLCPVCLPKMMDQSE